jgi:hypothetical protein
VGSQRARSAVRAICLAVALAAPASVVVVAGGGVASTPAAADPLPTPVTWSPTPCATAAVTGVREERSVPPVLWVSGWIRPCPEPGLADSFHAIWYYGPVARSSPRVRQYESRTEPTTFSLRLATPGGAEPTLGLTAVCVADEGERRVTCLAVEAQTPGVLPAVTPIATDDPRVRYPAQGVRPGDEGTLPVCGTCL